MTQAGCPAWCIITHGQLAEGDDSVHVGGALRVHRTILRLCSAGDEEPYLLFGDDELTLYHAEALAAALAQLVDAGRGPGPRPSVTRAARGTPPPGP